MILLTSNPRITLGKNANKTNKTVALSTSSSPPNFHAFRLKPHQDIKKEILAWAKQYEIKAGCLVTCVGSLEQLHLRYADQEKGAKQKGYFEIVSLVGTFSDSFAHLHLSVGDAAGKLIGGHLLEGNLIYTTAEIVVAELREVTFLRQKDDTYGYEELVVARPSREKKIR